MLKRAKGDMFVHTMSFTSDQVTVLCDLKKNGMSYSEVIRCILDEFIKNRELVKIVDGEMWIRQLESNQKRIGRKIKQDYNRMFFKKNILQRMFQLSWVDMMTNKSVDMNKIRRIVKNAKDLYQSFPEDMQKILRKDMDYIESLTTLDNIRECFPTLTQLRLMLKQKIPYDGDV